MVPVIYHTNAVQYYSILLGKSLFYDKKIG